MILRVYLVLMILSAAAFADSGDDVNTVQLRNKRTFLGTLGQIELMPQAQDPKAMELTFITRPGKRIYKIHYRVQLPLEKGCHRWSYFPVDDRGVRVYLDPKDPEFQRKFDALKLGKECIQYNYARREIERHINLRLKKRVAKQGPVKIKIAIGGPAKGNQSAEQYRKYLLENESRLRLSYRITIEDRKDLAVKVRYQRRLFSSNGPRFKISPAK